jgi:hypothetical protein
MKCSWEALRAMSACCWEASSSKKCSTLRKLKLLLRPAPIEPLARSGLLIRFDNAPDLD